MEAAAECIELPNGKKIQRKMFSEYTKEELLEVVKQCHSVKNMIHTLNLHGSYSKYINAFLESNKVDISHFTNDRKARSTAIEERLTKNSKNIKTDTIKNYLIKKKIVEEKCSVCKIPSIWNNKPLKLQLDHLNGDHYDNRIENLRLICPNCHSQTDTFTGRNRRIHEEKFCSECKTKRLQNANTTGKCIDCRYK